jgi:hypothetical protein
VGEFDLGESKMRRRLVSTVSFVATDCAGNRYSLEVLTEFEDVVVPGYFRSEAGKRKLCTSSGQPVSSMGESKFRIVETGLVITSVDPLAQCFE